VKNSKQIAIALGLIVFAVCGYFAYTLFSKNVPNLDDSGGFGQEIEESEIQPKLKESL